MYIQQVAVQKFLAMSGSIELSLLTDDLISFKFVLDSWTSKLLSRFRRCFRPRHTSAASVIIMRLFSVND